MLSTYLASTVDSVLTTTLANYREKLIDKLHCLCKTEADQWGNPL